jgi:hypothetical protein
MHDNEMSLCFFCGIRNSDKIFKVTDREFLTGYRIAVGIPPDEPVAWTMCNECERLDPTAITSHIHEDMIMKAVNRYRAGQPTIIVDDDMLRAFEALALNLHQRNHAPRNQASCREGNHRTSTVKTVRNCPRCGGPIPSPEHAGLYPGGISRVDGKTEICSACSEAEAMTWPNDPWKEEAWAEEQRARWIRR